MRYKATLCHTLGLEGEYPRKEKPVSLGRFGGPVG